MGGLAAGFLEGRAKRLCCRLLRAAQCCANCIAQRHLPGGPNSPLRYAEMPLKTRFIVIGGALTALAISAATRSCALQGESQEENEWL